MTVLRPRQGNLMLVFRLFKSHARQSLTWDLNNLKTCLRFPCLSLNTIIDSISLWISLDLDKTNCSVTEVSKGLANMDIATILYYSI